MFADVFVYSRLWVSRWVGALSLAMRAHAHVCTQVCVSVCVCVCVCLCVRFELSGALQGL